MDNKYYVTTSITNIYSHTIYSYMFISNYIHRTIHGQERWVVLHCSQVAINLFNYFERLRGTVYNAF